VTTPAPSFSSLGVCGRPDEVHLPPEPRIDEGADGVRADLAREVDLDGRVDRDQIVVLARDDRVVHVLDRMRFDERVVVEELVERVASQREGHDRLSAVQALLRPGDHPALYRAHGPVGDHLGVNAQLEPAVKGREDGIRNAADAHLERRALLDERQNVLADPLVDLGRRLAFQIRQPFRVLDDGVDAVHMDERIPQRPRHLLVDLDDHGRGGLAGGLRGQDLDAQAHEAVLVGGRALQHRHVQRDQAPLEEPGDVV
jgi:hypothetical protein